MSTMALVELHVKPEAVEGVKAGLKKLQVETRAYAGCQSIDVYNDLDGKGALVLYEKWDSWSPPEIHGVTSLDRSPRPTRRGVNRAAKYSLFRPCGCLNPLYRTESSYEPLKYMNGAKASSLSMYMASGYLEHRRAESITICALAIGGRLRQYWLSDLLR